MPTAIPALHTAIASGDVGKIQELIDSGANLEEIHPITGFRPLHVAAENGLTDVVRLLLQHGAVVDALSNPAHPAPFADCPALTVATAKSHRPVAEMLVGAGADVNLNVLSEHVSPAISWAAAAGDLDTVRYLLDRGAAIDGPILFPPVWNQDPAMVEFLIAHGADVNAKSGEGKPILVRACERPFRDVKAKEQAKIVAMLLDAGADMEARTDLGATALMAATQAKNSALALTLLSRGANARAADIGNMTALHSAATDGDLVLAEALLNAGADPTVANTFGETPITRAKENKDKAMVALLNSKS